MHILTTRDAEIATWSLRPLPRDTVRIIELDDEQVDGVVVYLTDYNRSITERLAKASRVACCQMHGTLSNSLPMF